MQLIVHLKYNKEEKSKTRMLEIMIFPKANVTYSYIYICGRELPHLKSSEIREKGAKPTSLLSADCCRT